MKKTQGFRIGMKVSVFSQLSLAALHRFSSAAALPRLPSSSSSAAASVAMSNSHDSAAAASSSSSSSSSLQQTNKRLRKDCAGIATPSNLSVRNFASEDSSNVGERKLKKTPRNLAVRNLSSYHSSNTCFLQIFGTGFDTGDTVPTVLLFFDQHRFIFNAGEGIQRYCTEHRIKLSKIDHIFLTRICSETAGGLPGLLLTLAGIGDSGMAAQICGPGEFQNLVNAIGSFVPNAATVYTRSFGGGEYIAAAPIVLVDNELVKISATVVCPQPGTDVNLKDKTCDNVSAVYICELPQILGKFDPQKAAAKGLKPGVKYGKLQKGEAVISDDSDEMVYPEDVLGPSSPGPIMILVDCPTVSYISALTSSSNLELFYSGSGKIVNCIVHLSPSSVTNCREYRDWMAKFKEAHHIMAGRHGEEPGIPILKSSARLLAKLNYICPDVFPVNGFFSAKNEGVTNEKDFSEFKQEIIAENLLKFHFRPLATLGPDKSCVPETFDMLATQKEFTSESPEILEAKDHVSQVWGENSSSSGPDETIQAIPECIQNASREEMEMVFLGTGSSQPSKYRNVSAIYVHLYRRGGILLDCGEGTYAQLRRRYGAKGADEVLSNIQCIWISHIHADHHSGLPRVLSARRKLVQNCSTTCPILVIGPRQLKRFLDAYALVEELDMVFLDSSQTTAVAEKAAEELTMKEACNHQAILESTIKRKDQGFHFQQGVDVAGRHVLKQVMHKMGLKSCLSVQVVHCLNAYGVVLESETKQEDGGNVKPGWKLVYSGDTRPCEAMVEASAGATVLIHEATFDDSMPVEAIMKNHSTTKEAIEVAKSAGVYRVILTHFSQRYPKIPVLSDNYTSHACISFDMMSVNLVDLPLVPKLLPAFRTVFRDEMLPDDEEMVA